MPALGESVTEGTVTRWLKNEGDHVNVDEPLLEVSTDKVDTEIPSPVSGTLTRIVVAIDSTVAVGAELAVIEDGVAAVPVAPVIAPPAAVAPVVLETPAAPVVIAPPVPVVAAPAASSSGVVVTMPALGESVTEGTVTRWLKNVGDAINVDEPLLEVSTDKVDTEIPSPATGTILAIDVAVDSTVAVGARLALIGAAGAAPVVAAPAPVAPQLDDSYVTPIVRQFAKEQGVDLASVTGSGIGGRIRKEDILAAVKPVAVSAPAVVQSGAKAAAPVSVSPLRGTTVTMTRLR